MLHERLPPTKQERTRVLALHFTSGGTCQVAHCEWPCFVNCLVLHKDKLLLCCSNDRYYLSRTFCLGKWLFYWSASTLGLPVLPSKLNQNYQGLLHLIGKTKQHNAAEEINEGLSLSYLMKSIIPKWRKN